MEAVWQSVLTGVPVLILHLIVAIAMLVIGAVVYMWMTPYEDLKLVREGNPAAGIAMGGALVGLAVPLASAVAASVNVYDILIWGVITLIVQIGVFKVVDWILKGLPKRIENGEIGAACMLTGTKWAVAAINAAAVSG